MYLSPFPDMYLSPFPDMYLSPRPDIYLSALGAAGAYDKHDCIVTESNHKINIKYGARNYPSLHVFVALAAHVFITSALHVAKQANGHSLLRTRSHNQIKCCKRVVHTCLVHFLERQRRNCILLGTVVPPSTCIRRLNPGRRSPRDSRH